MLCVAINALGGFGCLAMAAASVKLESCRLRSRQLEVRVAQLLVYELVGERCCTYTCAVGECCNMAAAVV